MTQEQRDRLTREKADVVDRRRAISEAWAQTDAAQRKAIEHCDDATSDHLTAAGLQLREADDKLAGLEHRIAAVLTNPTPLRDLLAQAAESLVYATEAWSGDAELDTQCSAAGIPACLSETAEALLRLTQGWDETMCPHGFEITGRDGDECPACAVEAAS